MGEAHRGGWRRRAAARGLAAAALLAGAAGLVPGAAAAARIYVSAADSSYLDGAGGNWAARHAATRAALARQGLTVRRTSSIAAAAEDRSSLLVLDHALAFGAAAWDSLEQAMRAGGRFLVLGPLATRDSIAGWIGWERMKRVLAARTVVELRPEQTDFVTLGATLPLGDDLQGRMLPMLRGPGSFGLVVDMPLALWSTWDRADLPGVPGPLAAAVAVQLDAGRMMWLGFPLAALEGHDGSVADSWMAGALDWLQGSPRAAFAAWPGGAEAALLLEMDTEDRFHTAEFFRDALDRRGLHGSFLCVSKLAEQHPALLRRIAARHEVGSHTEDHRVVEGLPAEEQHAKIEASRRALERIAGRPVSGFRPPEERYDAATLAALVRAGYRYLIAGYGDRVLPEILAVPRAGAQPAALVRLPRTARDDYELLILRHLPRDSVAIELAADLQRTRRIRGLHLVSLHTQILGGPEAIRQVEPFLDGLAPQPLWITTAWEAADWWLRRATCRLALAPRGKGWEVRVLNGGAVPVEALVVRLALPGPPRPLRATWRGLALAGVDFAGGGGRHETVLRPDAAGVVELPLPALAARTEAVCVLEY